MPELVWSTVTLYTVIGLLRFLDYARFADGRRKLGTWWGLSTLEKVWLAPTWLLLGIARACVLLIPFRHLAAQLGQNGQGQATIQSLGSTQSHRALRLGRAIRTAARYAPWNANCLAQALVAHWVLRLYRIPHTVCLGLKRDASNNALLAHAWVRAGTVWVTGGSDSQAFTVVKRFASADVVKPEHKGP